jgi:hypothetical protein
MHIQCAFWPVETVARCCSANSCSREQEIVVAAEDKATVLLFGVLTQNFQLAGKSIELCSEPMLSS